MTETRFTWRWLSVVAAAGLLAGCVIGLLFGITFMPNLGGTADVSALSASGQNDYIVLVANSYAFDQDLALARQRLALLGDQDINSRVERLAKALATRQDPDAANVADLAVALGSSDSQLKVLAASVINNLGGSAEPTKYAMAEVAPTDTPAPTDVPTNTPAPTQTGTAVPTKKPVVRTPAAPANPQPTLGPTAAPQLMPDLVPQYPQFWWPDITFTPASAAPGQQYWRLKWALFCDAGQTDNNCGNLPGGTMDHSIYVAIQNPDGTCADATPAHMTNDGKMVPMYKKQVAYPWNSCATTDWEWPMYGEGNDVWIDGMPSDRLSGMCMCNVTTPPGSPPGYHILQGHAHVRYFLIFQLATR